MQQPPEHLLSWAARAMTPGATKARARARATARVAGVRGLRDGANPWLIRFGLGGNNAAAVLKSASADGARLRTQIATQAAALVLAEDHGLPAPRLIAADLDGTTTGTVAMLTTALYFGLPAAREVLAGWEQAAGRAGDQVAYWDVTAALCTVGDMADGMPPLADHGRLDLDAGTLTARRDAFLGAALARLGRL